MKKLLVLFLTLACVISLCACDNASKKPSVTPTTNNEINTESTPNETESIVETEPSELDTNELKAQKQSKFEEVFKNKQYKIAQNSIRATMTKQADFAQLAAIKNENQVLYSVSGILPNGYIEKELFQNAQNEIYFHSKTVQTDTTENTETTENWYQCINTENFNIEQNLFDITFFSDAIENMTSLEYIDTDNHLAHITAYCDKTVASAEEPDTQLVFDIFIDDELYTIDSIRYYNDDVEWLLVFVQPEQANLYIPDGVEMTELDVNEAQNQMKDASTAVLASNKFAEDIEGTHDHPED